MKGPFLGGRLAVKIGDITHQETDVIVNAANTTLLGGGGVDGAIHRAGGQAILRACEEIRRTRYPGGLPTGEAVETTAGRLAARFVIHTVGPVWRGGTGREEELLTSCYRRSLELSVTLGAQSISFPAISTGVYGYPREKAAVAVWRTLREWVREHPEPCTIVLVFYSAEDARVFMGSPAAT